MCIHREPAYATLSRRFALGESELAQDNSILLPLYPALQEQEQDFVVNTLEAISASVAA
jgi:dTDP-4-amino-4,6-dideoxygalactose transaminase